MATAAQKQIKKILTDSQTVFPDRIVCKKNGSVEVHCTCLYTLKHSVMDWKAEVSSEINVAENSVPHQSESKIRWNCGLEFMYFVAIIHPVQE